MVNTYPIAVSIIVVLLIGTVGAVGIGHTTQADTHNPQYIHTDGETPSINGSWQRLHTNRTYIYYQKGYAQDARFIKRQIVFARQHIDDDFHLNYQHEIEVYVYPNATYPYTKWVTKATTNYSTQTGYTGVYIEVLAPSEHPAFGHTEDTERLEWYRHGITYAYVNIVTHRLQVVHGTADRNYPPWFKKGVPQYVALFDTNQMQRDHYANRIDTMISMIRSGNATLERINANPYIGGPLVIKFIVDTHGWESVIDIMTADATTFQQAVTTTLGYDTYASFEQAWLQWAASHYDNATTQTSTGLTSTQSTQTTVQTTTTTDTPNTQQSDRWLPVIPVFLLAGVGSILAIVAYLRYRQLP